MIHDVDESLRTLVRRDVLNGANVEVSFEAPTKEWSARRSAPTLDLYLYDIREDLQRRSVQYEEIRDERGVVVERRPPPRQFRLSYLVTAWTQRPEDEHRLLSELLGCFLPFDALPADVLQGDVASQPYPLRMTIGLPLPADRNISDVWSAFGGELKASLDLVVTAPFDARPRRPVGPPVLEERLVTQHLLAEQPPNPLPADPPQPPVFRPIAEEVLEVLGDPEARTTRTRLIRRDGG
jgi:hypothetical protein